ncbi:helix-turn-helix domain-containing protein [Falsihalocynthiibacter sp. SS001]
MQVDGIKIAEIAKQLGVGRSTLYRLLKKSAT